MARQAQDVHTITGLLEQAEENALSPDAQGNPMLSFSGTGPVLERLFTGTAFVATDDGLLRTNAHVALPWQFEEPAEALVQRGLIPVMQRQVGYLPGIEGPFDVELVVASETVDLRSFVAAVQRGWFRLYRWGRRRRGLAKRSSCWATRPASERSWFARTSPRPGYCSIPALIIGLYTSSTASSGWFLGTATRYQMNGNSGLGSQYSHPRLRDRSPSGRCRSSQT